MSVFSDVAALDPEAVQRKALSSALVLSVSLSHSLMAKSFAKSLWGFAQVCNHPELFERNEGRSFFQFASVANSLLPSAFGELECIHYSGACNPIAFKVTFFKRPSIATLQMAVCVSGHMRRTVKRIVQSAARSISNFMDV